MGSRGTGVLRLHHYRHSKVDSFRRVCASDPLTWLIMTATGYSTVDLCGTGVYVRRDNSRLQPRMLSLGICAPVGRVRH